jgi:protein-tyrosine phosphatase
MVRVLFVCLGNICRSTMAEALFAHKVRLGGLQDRFEADSAGTGHWHVGRPPHPGTQEILRRNGVRYEHRARLITAQDLNEFDYIVPMDSENLADVRRLGKGSAQIRTMMSFDPAAEVADVPDPYYDGQFDRVYRLLDRATSMLLETLCRNHEP